MVSSMPKYHNTIAFGNRFRMAEATLEKNCHFEASTPKAISSGIMTIAIISANMISYEVPGATEVFYSRPFYLCLH